MIKLNNIDKFFGSGESRVSALKNLNIVINEGEFVTIHGLSRFRSEYLGFVFQAFNLISYMTLEENVMLPLAHKKLSNAEKKKKALTILEKVGLADRLNHLPSELSGGQQQRAAIARALVNDPKILFADEPTGNLDSKTRDEILHLFKELNSWGHTIIMVTHDDSSIKVASRAIKLSDGEIV